MILRDPHAGHRNYFTGEPDGAHDAWTSWDFALATATQAIIDGTTEDGHLRWEIEADDVDVIAVHDIDKAREAREIITSQKDYKPGPGEYLKTRLRHPYYRPEDGEEKWQTRAEWFEKLMKEEEQWKASG